MTPYGGHRSKDRGKSKYANPNIYVWDGNGRLIGKKRYDKHGNMRILPITKDDL